ncbi:carboxylating nicotinate-nucleotide diphosphorylase [bacterium LRH843]|nr:carboxylating nicotinate-nucleotide diphosphorylase [bacterium LRH843]
MSKLIIKEQLQRFLIEDIGEGDRSSEAVIPSDLLGFGRMIAKEDGIMAGGAILTLGFELLDSNVRVGSDLKDGEAFQAGDTIATIEGPVRSLLAGERVLLNLLQRMSGIATMTKNAINKLDDETIRICDTRKTTPGLRQFEKYSVRCGGGYNHRFGLNDAVMLKENHILAGGGIINSVKKVREQIGHMVKVEVETTNEVEVIEAVKSGADIIMFDNAAPQEILTYMKHIPVGVTTEASGGISLENIATFKGTGVDYISLGCLTHSVKAMDISFLLEKGEI